MTDHELAPYLAIPIREGMALDRAWSLLRTVAEQNPDLAPEPFSEAVLAAVAESEYPIRISQ
ncbi:hypothetical protein [Rhodococcus pyridinivorans]|uniref:hypothetical protein n=1 Tax=Rhodococcus pyridinivorans TaxID=103816 RepID=UPI001113DCC8|nr:hypothetical protein [Rhodococcus pyridinivorans]